VNRCGSPANIATFDHPDWIFELKLDGFRALAHFENGKAELVSRNGNIFASFGTLTREIADTLRERTESWTVKIPFLWNSHGYPQFEDLMFRRGELFFVALDALMIDGEDLRNRPLIERKARLKEVVSSRQTRRSPPLPRSRGASRQGTL